jgi:hypothetical protein
MGSLKVFVFEKTVSAKFTDICATSPMETNLDAVYFLFCCERFGDGQIRRHERQMRHALQEVVQRVQSERPSHFQMVKRVTYPLMHGEPRLGILTTYASRAGARHGSQWAVG